MDNNSNKKKALKLAVGGVHLQPAGHKIGEFSAPLSLRKAPTMIYPSLSLDLKEAPGLKGLETGDEVTLVARGRVVSHSSSSSLDNKSEHFRIEFTHIGAVNPKTDSKAEESAEGE